MSKEEVKKKFDKAMTSHAVIHLETNKKGEVETINIDGQGIQLLKLLMAACSVEDVKDILLNTLPTAVKDFEARFGKIGADGSTKNDKKSFTFNVTE